MLRRRANVWQIGDVDRELLWQVRLDAPSYGNSLLHDASVHILKQKEKYDRWLEDANPEVVANALMILCLRVNKMLQSMMSQQLEEFKAEGGFTENMTQERLEARRAGSPDSPACPVCGKPMLKRMIRKGVKQGLQFWGCSDYPRCRGARDI